MPNHFAFNVATIISQMQNMASVIVGQYVFPMACLWNYLFKTKEPIILALKEISSISLLYLCVRHQREHFDAVLLLCRQNLPEMTDYLSCIWQASQRDRYAQVSPDFTVRRLIMGEVSQFLSKTRRFEVGTP